MELIGAKLPSIDRAEDRLLFKNAMTKIGLKTPTSGTAESWDDAIKACFCQAPCQSCGALSSFRHLFGIIRYRDWDGRSTTYS